MHDVNSRYQLVDQAIRLPGQCLFTKTDKGPFIDTGLTLNKFDSMFAESNLARVYISVDVIREMAEQAGLFEQLREKMNRDIDIAHDTGVREGIADGHDLVGLADRLGSIADRVLLGAVVAAPTAPVGDGAADGSPLVFDGSEPLALVRDGGRADEAPGQGNRSGRSRRPAGVSTDPGDEQYRI